MFIQCMPKYFVIDDSGLLGYYAISLCVFPILQGSNIL